MRLPDGEHVKNLMTVKYTQSLRLDLIAMMRISQRAVDYAAKSYESGFTEFAKQARREWPELYSLNQRILSKVQQMRGERVADIHLQFGESARSISTSLVSVCHHAYDVAMRAAEHSEKPHPRSQSLVQMLEHINHSMRLCAVAFMNKRVELAEAVLHDEMANQFDDTKAMWGQTRLASAAIVSAPPEASIATSLQQMIKDTRTIALASAAIIWASSRQPGLAKEQLPEVLVSEDSLVCEAVAGR